MYVFMYVCLYVCLSVCLSVCMYVFRFGGFLYCICFFGWFPESLCSKNNMVLTPAHVVEFDGMKFACSFGENTFCSWPWNQKTTHPVVCWESL